MSVGRATIRGLRQVTAKDENEKKTKETRNFQKFSKRPIIQHTFANILQIRPLQTKSPLENLKARNPHRPLCGAHAKKKRKKERKKNACLMELASWRNGVNFRKSGKSLMIIPVT